jgi:hypothetical protein
VKNALAEKKKSRSLFIHGWICPECSDFCLGRP